MSILKVFIDTDVVLDVLLKREPFFDHAQIIFDLAEKGKIEAHVSSLIFSNLFYIIRKYESSKKAIEALRKLKILFHVLSVDERIIQLALASDFHDFEDAIQYYTAIENHMKYLVTRNESDYKARHIDVCNPKHFSSLPVIKNLKAG